MDEPFLFDLADGIEDKDARELLFQLNFISEASEKYVQSGYDLYSDISKNSLHALHFCGWLYRKGGSLSMLGPHIERAPEQIRAHAEELAKMVLHDHPHEDAAYTQMLYVKSTKESYPDLHCDLLTAVYFKALIDNIFSQEGS